MRNKEYEKEYYRQNKEKLLAYAKEYRMRNLEDIREYQQYYQAKLYEERRDEVLARQRAYRHKKRFSHNVLNIA